MKMMSDRRFDSGTDLRIECRLRNIIWLHFARVEVVQNQQGFYNPTYTIPLSRPSLQPGLGTFA